MFCTLVSAWVKTVETSCRISFLETSSSLLFKRVMKFLTAPKSPLKPSCKSYAMRWRSLFSEFKEAFKRLSDFFLFNRSTLALYITDINITPSARKTIPSVPIKKIILFEFYLPCSNC